MRGMYGNGTVFYVVLWSPFGFYTITMTMYYNVSTAGVTTIRKSGATKVLVTVERIQRGRS
jgi:hypothetical protein